MRPNTALRAWRAGKQTVGLWLGIPSGHTAEALAHSGFDWLCIDMQHGMIGFSDAAAMVGAINAVGKPAIVRVLWNEPGLAGRLKHFDLA